MPAGPEWIAEAIRFDQDPDTGATIEQLTSEPVTSTNIYPEQRFASADGTRIAISRKPFGQPTQLWVCDLRSYRLCRIDEGEPIGANPSRDAVYYLKRVDGSARLKRLNLADLTTEELLDFHEQPPPQVGAMSPDERYFVGGPYPMGDKSYCLHRLEMGTGKQKLLCEIEDMSNPHLQIEPGSGDQVLVQINRGDNTDSRTGHRQLSGKLGATLAVVSLTSGEVTSLPVGRPHTPGITGHECWAGTSGEIVFTAGQYRVSKTAFVTFREPSEEEHEMPAAAIYGIKPGQPEARIVSQGLLFNHLAASDDGRFFVADDHLTGRIYIGSLKTGRYLGLCDSNTRQGQCQHSHVHAYLTGDNRHVVFTSIATGVAQVYAALLPADFLAPIS